MSAPEVVNELEYRAYVHQRMKFPEVSPERWALIFGPATVEFEERFLKTFISKLFEAADEIGEVGHA